MSNRTGCFFVVAIWLFACARAGATDFDWSDCFLMVTPAVSAVPPAEILHRLSVFFDFDGDDLRPEDVDSIRQFVAAVEVFENQIAVTAHADDKGSAAYNVELAGRRLDAALRALSVRIPSELLEGTNYGDELAEIPKAATDADRQPDRRVDIMTFQVIPGRDFVPEQRTTVTPFAPSLNLSRRPRGAPWLFSFGRTPL